jgi:penicillin-binding protein 2
LRDLMGNIDEKAFQPQTLLENVPKDQALVLISQQDQIPGFEIQKNPIRDYKDAESFSHLIGYTGKITGQELTDRKGQGYLLYDFIGKTGIEVEYEEYLKGLSGKKQVEIDVQGNYKKDLGEVAAIPGNNVSLKVDAGLQKVLYDSLLKHATISRSRKAAAVAQNPKTGEVLALVSLPGFDTNQFAQGISSEDYSRIINDPDIPLLNRVIGGTYPPGSTIKPALGIAALTEGVVTPQTRILDDGVIRIGVFTYYGYDRSGLGLMNIYSAIARSSDIYFYTVGGGNPKNDIQGMGPDKLAEWYRKFNLGSLTAIDLPSEKDGLVPDPEWKLKTRNERWFLGNTYHYSIGQGDLLVTPLQLNTLIGSIANGGRIMQPYILNQVTDFSGEIIDKSEPKIVKENFLDPEYLKIVQDAMRQTVTSGSGIRLNSLPIAVAGKTGTAQFSSRDPNLTHAWFTSYAPFEDPEIVLTILVEGGGEGSSTAAPVAKEVYQWWADNRLDIEE